jgi:hypothetical protein
MPDGTAGSGKHARGFVVHDPLHIAALFRFRRRDRYRNIRLRACNTEKC